MPTENLWGDIPTSSDIKPPVTILREQATILSEATNKILIGDVTVSKDGPQVTSRLFIEAPALDNYVYVVLSVKHDIMLYPLKVVDVATGVLYQCEDEEQYRAALKLILSSPRVHKVVASLIAQSKAT
jgi:riboflavin biosynthesis pyrimidine reductase